LLLAALLVAAAAGYAGSPRDEKTVIDLLMPGAVPVTSVSSTDPPPSIRALLADIFSSVQKVDLSKYLVKATVSDDELMADFARTLGKLGWERRIAQPGRGIDAVFTHDTKTGPFEVLYVEVVRRGNEQEVTFTRVAGSKGGSVVTPRSPTVRKEVTRSMNGLRIEAAGPSFQYEAWTQEIVEVNRLRPGGQQPMPEIMSQGSFVGIQLVPASLSGRPGGLFGMSPFAAASAGLDYTVRAPQRFAVIIDSSGSPVTVNLNGIRQLELKAVSAPVTLLGIPTDGTHKVDAVNERVVLNLGALQRGELRVNGTNAEITANLPSSSDVELNAHAVAGMVTVKSPGSGAQTDNPAKLSLGSGRARLVIEAVSGRITINVK